MPVILTTPEEWEIWLTGSVEDARALQRPLPSEALKIVATGAKSDGAPASRQAGQPETGRRKRSKKRFHFRAVRRDPECGQFRERCIANDLGVRRSRRRREGKRQRLRFVVFEDRALAADPADLDRFIARGGVRPRPRRSARGFSKGLPGTGGPALSWAGLPSFSYPQGAPDTGGVTGAVDVGTGGGIGDGGSGYGGTGNGVAGATLA